MMVVSVTSIERQLMDHVRGPFALAANLDADTQIEFPEAKITLDGRPWVRVNLVESDRVQRTFGRKGNRRFQVTGTLFFHIYIPRDAGPGVATDIVDSVRDEFEAKSFKDGLRTQSARHVRIGPTPDERYFQTNAEVEYQYHEVR